MQCHALHANKQEILKLLKCHFSSLFVPHCGLWPVVELNDFQFLVLNPRTNFKVEKHN